MGKKVTYASYGCDYRTLKEEKFRVRNTVGGNKLTYGDDARSPAINILENKILLNSTVLDTQKGAMIMSIHIKDQKTEHVIVQCKQIP